MVNIICSEWIPSENIPFKIGIFIDWKVAWLPPGGGEGETGLLDGKTYPYHRWCAIMNIIKMYGIGVEICSEIVSCPYICPKRRLRWRLLKHEIRKSLKTGLWLKCSYFWFLGEKTQHWYVLRVGGVDGWETPSERGLSGRGYFSQFLSNPMI